MKRTTKQELPPGYEFTEPKHWVIVEKLAALYRKRVQRIRKVTGLEYTMRWGRFQLDVDVEPTEYTMEFVRGAKRRMFREINLSTNRPRVRLSVYYHDSINEYGDRLSANDGTMGSVVEYLDSIAKTAGAAAKAIRADMRKHPVAWKELPTVEEFFAKECPGIEWEPADNWSGRLKPMGAMKPPRRRRTAIVMQPKPPTKKRKGAA